ncbi:MAG: Bcr/CflA family multidrug efflux MFS transporter [Rhodospirillaceae bacterium]|nr:Bcr/CflA family multidrug efflux MFS transporter [Rhodospirillales bacterium]
MIRSRREIILILGIFTALAPLSIDMYLPALPELGRFFAADPARVQWTLSSFFLGFALGQAFYGPVADRWGRKPPLYGSMALFALASAGCAVASSIDVLTGLRFLQALGACAGGVIARAMVRDLFEPKEAPRIYASLMLVMGAAPMLAPLVGGGLLAAFGWRSIFWALAATGIIGLALLHFRLPESHLRHEGRAGGLVGVLLAYGRLLCDRRFMADTLAGGIAMAGMFAYISGSPFVFIQLHGVAAEHFGWFFGANALGFIIVAQINGRLLNGIDPRRVLLIGQLIQISAGAVLVTDALAGWGGLAGIAAPLFIFIASLGFITPSAVALAMAPQGANAGTASALLGTLQFSIAALASSVLGLLQDGSAVPMTVVMAGCSLSGLVISRALARG